MLVTVVLEPRGTAATQEPGEAASGQEAEAGVGGGPGQGHNGVSAGKAKRGREQLRASRSA